MQTELVNLFARVRRRLRSALLWECVGRLVTAAAVLFWIGLAVDWSLEPSVPVRQTALLAAALGVLTWLARTSLEPLLRPLPNRQLALLIERRDRGFADALITAVDLAENRAGTNYDAELAAATVERAVDRFRRRGDPQLIDPTPARRWATAAAIGLASVVLFGLVNADALGVYSRRLAFSPEAWPRRVSLIVEGFPRNADGVRQTKIARGDSIDLAVRAELTAGHEAPAQVWLRYRFDDGPRGRDALARIGEPTGGGDPHQRYRTSLDDIRSDATLWIRGGDDRVGPLEVVVAPRPVVVAAEMEITPPGYLNLPASRVAAIAAGAVPEGSRVWFSLATNKPIAEAQTEWAGGDGPPVSVELEPGSQSLRIAVPPLLVDGLLQVTLTDTDGIASAEPHPLPIAVEPDRRPRVELRLVGVGALITPDANIRVAARMEDDHAVGGARVDVEIDGQPADRLAMDPDPVGRRQIGAGAGVDLLTKRYEQGLDAGRLEPGQSLTLTAAASDRCDLRPDEDRTVTSSRFKLEVVTPDRFLAQIEQREINLRRTFEQTVSEMRRVERRFGAPSGEEQPSAERVKLQRSRVADEVSKVAQDTAAAGEAFATIHAELINNRIANDDLLQRIDEAIARPLKELSTNELPLLVRELKGAEPANGEAPTGAERQLAETITDRMEAILEQMKSLETYNEVLAMLRQVIDDQDRVRRDTERTRRDQVRRLLLE